MPDRVHAAVDRTQTTASKAMIDRVRAESQAEELLPPEDTVLALLELGDRPVDPTRVTLTAYFAVNVTFVGHRPSVAPQLWRRGPGL